MKLSEVKTVVDSERGCGWRKPGGLYLRLDGDWEACGKLPVPLSVCPCCGEGIKQARSWTWFNPRPFLAVKECAYAAVPGDERALKCLVCPMANPPEKAGLLWVGEKFYPTPAEWMEEARKLGISRRIKSVPHGFKLGDRVYMAHPKAIQIPGINPDECKCPVPDQGAMIHQPDCGGRIFQAAIFTTFVPDRIEYVCKGTETEEELDEIAKRGITPVQVVRDVDQPQQTK